ncbi:MAG: hypothetical protein A3C93_02380 [Candidatus Lloydbacteria bacterium RIFCSPHIGHO2_02_FULL_54_17]|uniref:Uncharacterized protein n=1 Tax=Candidatus Lloydbacteria bacterium RIFCSPHIGHO2_02_FULL_54_17 TaxID=1798664 RepID=A0A1G2DFW9_9BACT|nr:MAG: hypothetical protein A2762_04525 [Candidatus Lloydbacteria bacterium RIFCSPHIGHO2_01_FULL_54_11]OGZ11760.1 MAG: hypothetical protein A3C93_02380 [Candidatus Lloydbacteria bacterium RIFCSPHIGHO2_02_FULL_54_17]OGZ14289.1 MAG: hypothetical protein A2948_01715 [Candidatus Lloydbacteria bacterium RIFCSPLOWO2_01_FULL_54_18]OGZ16043.1 MAG: hypothetical protein A3H76_00770 [Candidatus Lloydbacteria bacterium RIFCSPLOWO2_02_FULL_54_12]
MDALLRCSRYAFGPNRLHYCGPAKNTEMRDYINDETADLGLREILEDFETMYPYLLHIARANKIDDPLNDRVVEAYWVGNELLDRVSKNDLYWHLVDNLSLKKKLGKSFALVEDKIAGGAVPHHSFHVLDIWKRTGFIERAHTLESMDECRVSWGRVTAVAGPSVTVLYEPLLYKDGKLTLGTEEPRALTRRLEAEYDIEQLAVGDLVSIHWGVICEVLSRRQTASLKKYTLRHIALANQTI